MNRAARTILTTATLAAVSGGAAAQSGSVWDTLRPVEQGRSDLSPLAVESRVEPIELRRANGFESLFRGQDQYGQNWFARRDAGLTAIFERSWYVTEDLAGTSGMTLIPPGTTFVIGEPTSILASRLGLGTLADREFRDASGGLRIESRQNTRIAGQGQDHTEHRTASAGGDARSDHAGRRGVSGLLQMAATREKLGG